jgi:hypothetical protein
MKRALIAIASVGKLEKMADDALESTPLMECRSKAQNPPVGRSLACHDFANGEQMSRLSSVLGTCCSNHRLRPRPTRRG